MTSEHLSRLPILWDSFEPHTVNTSRLSQWVSVSQQKVLRARRVVVFHNEDRVKSLQLG
jgi:hypothetical protein